MGITFYLVGGRVVHWDMPTAQGEAILNLMQAGAPWVAIDDPDDGTTRALAQAHITSFDVVRNRG
jgi:hypothetical protein